MENSNNDSFWNYFNKIVFIYNGSFHRKGSLEKGKKSKGTHIKKKNNELRR